MTYQCTRCGEFAAGKNLGVCLSIPGGQSMLHNWVFVPEGGHGVVLTADQMPKHLSTYTHVSSDRPQEAHGQTVAFCSMEEAHKVLAVTDSAWHKQVGGDHYYQGGISPFEYSMANGHNCLEFSIVKYLRKKGDKAQRLEDLRKLIDCAQKLLEWEEKDGHI